MGIELAETLHNVTEAAKISGVARQTIYRNRKILREKGAHALKRTFKKNHYHKNRTDKNLENLIIEFSLENPRLGQAQIALQLKETHQAEISPAGVRNVWLRVEMQTSALRMRKAIASKKMLETPCQSVY